MKIVLAPDSFKASLAAVDVCAAMAEGVARVRPDAELVARPMADGGEGTTAALVAARGGELRAARVTGPLGHQSSDERVEATFGLLDGGATAVVEMASASGLPLVAASRRNPRHTTSYGAGELIRAALDAGARRILVGIGGSATTDLGAGMAQALGVRFFDAAGETIARPLTGEALARVAGVELGGRDTRLAGCRLEVACDVDNPLLGPRGAAAVYGPQKGASPEDVACLEGNLAHVAGIVEAAAGRTLRDEPGAGAAGGLGFGALAFLDARLRTGIEVVMDAAGLAEALDGAALCLTGEGRLDGQTAHGKTVSGVAKLAASRGVPAIALVGSIAPGVETLWSHGLTSAFSICPGPVSLGQAIAEAPRWIADTSERVLRLWRHG